MSKAIKEAVHRTRIPNAHDSGELLGHSDVRTTIIYTHTVRSMTLKEAKSPLDF